MNADAAAEANKSNGLDPEHSTNCRVDANPSSEMKSLRSFFLELGRIFENPDIASFKQTLANTVGASQRLLYEVVEQNPKLETELDDILKLFGRGKLIEKISNHQCSVDDPLSWDTVQLEKQEPKKAEKVLKEHSTSSDWLLQAEKAAYEKVKKMDAILRETQKEQKEKKEKEEKDEELKENNAYAENQTEAGDQAKGEIPTLPEPIAATPAPARSFAEVAGSKPNPSKVPPKQSLKHALAYVEMLELPTSSPYLAMNVVYQQNRTLVQVQKADRKEIIGVDSLGREVRMWPTKSYFDESGRVGHGFMIKIQGTPAAVSGWCRWPVFALMEKCRTLEEARQFSGSFNGKWKKNAFFPPAVVIGTYASKAQVNVKAKVVVETPKNHVSTEEKQESGSIDNSITTMMKEMSLLMKGMKEAMTDVKERLDTLEASRSDM